MKLSNSIKDKVGHINTSKKQNKGKIFYRNTKLKQKKKNFSTSISQKTANQEGRMVTGSICHRSKWS